MSADKKNWFQWASLRTVYPGLDKSAEKYSLGRLFGFLCQPL